MPGRGPALTPDPVETARVACAGRAGESYDSKLMRPAWRTIIRGGALPVQGRSDDAVFVVDLRND